MRVGGKEKTKPPTLQRQMNPSLAARGKPHAGVEPATVPFRVPLRIGSSVVAGHQPRRDITGGVLNLSELMWHLVVTYAIKQQFRVLYYHLPQF